MQDITLEVSAQQAGRRLDMFILDFAKEKNLGFSRTFIQGLISRGQVSLAGAVVRPHYKVKTADQVRIILEEKKTSLLEAENIPLQIVYQDDDLAVINKPAGLVVHPAPGNANHTLVNALLYHFKNLSDINPQRPGIVHRLDKETSGLLVIAKNNPSHLNLAAQFSKHTVKRKYIALVKGKVEFDEDIIELPIVRHPVKRKSMSVGFSQGSKYAKTHYRTLRRSKNFSLLELKPFTGRTHQLRVHLDFIGHPILGDKKYGRDNKFIRLALHAKSIGFIHPVSAKFMEFSSDTPVEFSDFLKENKA